MQPLKISAHLVDGFVSKDKWSPSIDGIIAYQHMLKKLGPDEFAATQGVTHDMQPVTGLPMEVVEHENVWWYACSSPIFDSAARTQKHFHRRFDQQHSERIDFGKKSGKVLVQAGPYKNYRRAIYKTLCASLSWHVIGDESRIRELLDRVTHVGAKSSQGYGEVRKWEITEGDAKSAMHCRAVPVDYAKLNGIEGVEMIWGIRPPARLPENKFTCVVPQ